MRFVRYLLTFIALGAIVGSWCARARAQEMTMDLPDPGGAAPPAGAAAPLMPFTPDMVSRPSDDGMKLSQADVANLDGCKKLAQIDDQIILACEVLWRVNKLIEDQKKKLAEGQEVKKEEIDAVRQQLMKREVAMLVDRKLLFNEFRRVAGENLPRIEENLREPFEEKKLPMLFEQLGVKNQSELEQELARLGSSVADERRAFNEQIIAAEWIHSKVKVNDEISPDEMWEYYQAHLTDFEYPTQARWEELAVRKDKFKDPGEAFATIALMGNEAWKSWTGSSEVKQPTSDGTTYFAASLRPDSTQRRGAAFAEIAKTKSDGFTGKEGGLHDWTTKGSLQCKSIDNALFTLEVGQLSPILDSGPMFHIVRVLERKEAGRKPYTEVQGDIRDKLKDKRYQVEVEKYLSRLRGEARIWTVFTGDVSADTLLGRKPDETKTR